MKLNVTNKLYKWQKKQQNEQRKTDVSLSGFYNSKQWRKLREYKLSLNPICEHCYNKFNKLTKGYIVDHIKPITNEYDDKALDLDNLQTLCYNCHQYKTRIDNSKYSTKNINKGKEIQDELNKLD